MSQHTSSHKNSLNLLGEKYLNESHWPMHRIRLLECRAYFIELPSTFKTLWKRLRIRLIMSVNYHYITVLCPFNLLIRFKCYNTV